jgi:signal transduction histidine kinase
MKLDVLWQISARRAWLVSMSLSLILLTGLSAVKTPAQSLASLLVIVASILLFAFLARLPIGKWWMRILFEIACLVGSTVLLVLGSLWLFALSPDVVNFAQTVMPFFLLLSLFSHVAVRIFARPFAVWRRMRHRRLMWEITHAQLRLVILAVVVLFLIMISFTLMSTSYSVQSPPDFVVNAVTLFISVAGFFGIITGILLFIVIIPAGVISYLTARNITRRIERLTAVTHAVGNAHNFVRVAVEGEDEIARLQADFNTMVERLEVAHRDLEHERDTVRQLLKSRQRLFADVSHELRTPITTVRSYLESARTSGNYDDAEVIEREVLRLQHLVDDVFMFARADVDQLPYDMKPLEIGAVLERVAHIMRKQAWQARKVDVVLDYRPQLPLVLADEERVEQTLYNLLHNAVRHTPPGGLIRIAATAEPDVIKIDVQDTGEGISPQDLPHIWDRFYRSHETRANDSHGSGLGLALVKELVEAMGGQVEVTSALGQGSCFSLTLCRVR